MERVLTEKFAKMGQMRVVEVILASFVIMFAVTFANIFAITPTSPKYEATELQKLGYNVLHELDDKGILAYFVYEEQWENLTAALRVLLPLDVYFNLTVYDLKGAKINGLEILYGKRETFTFSKNIASVTYGLIGYIKGVNSTYYQAIYNPRILIMQLVRG
jgi:hypothetical protein